MSWIDARLDVWHDDVYAHAQLGSGPQRVSTEEPPADWTPPAPVGFAPPASRNATSPEVDEPQTWDGDQA